jgi:Zn finger protein HypA/HybF involved in hydrogenase expression
MFPPFSPYNINREVEKMKKTRKKRSVIWLTPLDDFKEIVKNSTTIKEVILSTGLNFCSSHYKTVNARIEYEGIDKSHFDPISNRNPSMIRIPLEQVLVENSYYTRALLKPRLVSEGLLEEKCECCGIGSEWNGKPLSLQLDHKNGINDDNRLENLRFLCPNCHSQTDTFGARNHKKKEKPVCKNCGGPVNKKAVTGFCIKCHGIRNRKIERPSKDILLKQVEELGYAKTGRLYGVSDNAIRKWLKN